MWIFKGIIILLAVITLAVFFAQNSSQSVDLRLLHWQWLQIPLYMVLVGSFLAGILVSLVVGGVRSGRSGVLAALAAAQGRGQVAAGVEQAWDLVERAVDGRSAGI